MNSEYQTPPIQTLLHRLKAASLTESSMYTCCCRRIKNTFWHCVSRSPSRLCACTMPLPLANYIYDLPAQLHSTVRLFADDTIAYLVIENLEDASLLPEGLHTLTCGKNNRGCNCSKLKVTSKRNPIQDKIQFA